MMHVHKMVGTGTRWWRCARWVHLHKMVGSMPGRGVVFLNLYLHIRLFLLRESWSAPEDVLDHVRGVGKGDGGEGRRAGVGDARIWAEGE